VIERFLTRFEEPVVDILFAPDQLGLPEWIGLPLTEESMIDQ